MYQRRIFGNHDVSVQFGGASQPKQEKVMAKVLLVDDEEGLRMMIGRQLRRGGHEVTQAEDGMAAIEALKQDQFDIVVSDMKMPRLDGMGLLARAREIAPKIEFIILTGHGNL